MRAVTFISVWMTKANPPSEYVNLNVFHEVAGSRTSVVDAICDVVKDHFVGLSLIEGMGGYPKAVAVVKNSLPTRKNIRSGDLGEILATEYVHHETGYRVLVKRLRFKDDRNMSMRGTDVIGVRADGLKGTAVLKVEVKSRAKLTSSVVTAAVNDLMKHSARPNPSTLSFISRRLREDGQIADAELVEALQQRDVPASNIEHLVFTFSGNDPAKVLQSFATVPPPSPKRHLVGFVVKDHQQFIADVFTRIG